MAQRECGTCTLCCKVMSVPEIGKAENTWCSHCLPSGGCKIYQSRPGECRTFNCGWLMDPSLAEDWYPKKSKIVLTMQSGHIFARVDPATPAAWRKSPYFEQLNRMMQKNLPRGVLVYLVIGDHFTLLLPDRQEELGVLRPNDDVQVKTIRHPQGAEYKVTVVRDRTMPLPQGGQTSPDPR